MGFPRQEYRSRWPFPIPRDIPNPGIKPVFLALVGGFFMIVPSGKTYVFSRWHTFSFHRICAMLSHLVMSDSLWPHEIQSARLLCPWGFSKQGWCGLPYPPPGDLRNPEIEPKPPALQANSLLYGPPGKPMNTGVDSLSLLQDISWPRNWTRISYIAGRFSCSWATREATLEAIAFNEILMYYCF